MNLLPFVRRIVASAFCSMGAAAVQVSAPKPTHGGSNAAEIPVNISSSGAVKKTAPDGEEGTGGGGARAVTAKSASIHDRAERGVGPAATTASLHLIYNHAPGALNCGANVHGGTAQPRIAVVSSLTLPERPTRS